MRKLVCAICMSTALALTTSALAADGQNEATTPAKVMTLEQAMEYAAEHHPGVKTVEANIDQLKVAQQEGWVMRYNAQHMSGSGLPLAVQSSMYTYQTTTARRGLAYDIATANLTIAEKSLEQTQKSVALNVKGSFYQYVTAQEKVKLYENALAAAQERYEYGKLKLEQGTISQLELDQIGLAAEQAAMQQKNAEHDCELMQMRLKNAMGLPVETELTVTGVLALSSMPEVAPDEAIKLAMESSLDVIKAEQQLVAEEKSFEATAGYYPENTFTYKQAKYSFEAMQHQKESAIENAKLGIYQAYNNMIAAYDGYALAAKSSELSSRAYEVARLQFELGLITATDLEEAANRATEAELARADALYGAVMGAASYEFSYTVGSLMSY